MGFAALWDTPGSGIKPMSPWVGRWILSHGPAEKACGVYFYKPLELVISLPCFTDDEIEAHISTVKQLVAGETQVMIHILIDLKL